MKLLRLILVVLVGCAHGPHPGDSLRPVGLDGWAETVQRAVDTWAEALGPDCPRFVVKADGKFYVKLISTWDWEGSATGYYIDGKGITIRGDRITGRQRQLLHELGHGIGIYGGGHSLNPSSIMHKWPTVDAPSEEDIHRARKKLGCEPTTS